MPKDQSGIIRETYRGFREASKPSLEATTSKITDSKKTWTVLKPRGFIYTPNIAKQVKHRHPDRQIASLSRGGGGCPDPLPPASETHSWRKCNLCKKYNLHHHRIIQHTLSQFLIGFAYTFQCNISLSILPEQLCKYSYVNNLYL